MKIIFGILGLLLVAGCSTYSKKDCEAKDWYQEGFASAREGHTDDRIAHYQKSCSEEHGVAVNSTQFNEGFQKGLVYFCTEQHGRNFGREGKVYRGTCPKEAEASFLKTYESGRLDFLVQKVSSLESEISDLRTRNSSLESELSTFRNRSCD